MKYGILSLGLAAMLAACADMSSLTTVDANASAKTKMRACLLSEANTKLQDGTLFSASVSATAKEIVNVCAKDLMLQSAGITEESQKTAESIITNLKNLNSAE